MGFVNLLFDGCFLALWVRAIVPNEGHMAFNRPYQWVVRLLEPAQTKLHVPERQARWMSFLGIIVLIGMRGLWWGLVGTGTLDVQVTSPVSHGFIQSQLLSPLAAAVFVLQLYAFITMAIAIGALENRTDHYSRLLRAILGPLKSVPLWLRCIFPALGLVCFWSGVSWFLALCGLLPRPRLAFAGCVFSSIPITVALYVDLANVWIVLIVVRAMFSFLPFWRPPVLDVIERITETALKPLYRLNLKTGQFDFTPVVSIIVLALLHYLLLGFTIHDKGPVLNWIYEKLS